MPSRLGARVHIEGKGKYTVTDGPFAETKELACGMCLLEVPSREEAIAWTKRFLEVVGGGESELLQLHEVPAA